MDMNPTPQELRKFALVTGALFAAIFGFLLPWVWEFNYPRWPWWLLGILAIWSFIHAPSLIHVYRPWMKFSHALGWVNSRIILGILFYLVFFPVGLVMRLMGKDPLPKKFSRSEPSYRIEKEERDKGHMEKPY